MGYRSTFDHCEGSTCRLFLAVFTPAFRFRRVKFGITAKQAVLQDGVHHLTIGVTYMRTIKHEELASIVGGDMQQVVVSHRKDGAYAGAVVHKSMGVSNPGRSSAQKGGGSNKPASEKKDEAKPKVEETSTTVTVCTEPTATKFNFTLNPLTRTGTVEVEGTSGSCTTTHTKVRKTSR